MTIATPHVNTGASGNLETAAPHGAQAPAGRGALSRRHLYMSAAALALLVVAGQAGIRPAEAAGIKSTTPTNLNITDIGTLLNNRSRSASGGDVVTTGSDSAGVDVQVKLQLGQQIPFVGWVNLGSPFDSVGDIDIDVGDVDAQYPGQKGINATNASGNININAGDILSDGMGVDARVKGFAGITILGNTIAAIPGIGNIAIDVGDVTSADGGGIDAATGFGTIDVKAGNIFAGDGLGVNATTQFNVGIDLGNLDLSSALVSAFSGDGIAIDVGNVESSGTGINAAISGVANVPLIGDLPGLGSIKISAGDVGSVSGNGIDATTGLGLVLVSAGDVDARTGNGVDAQTGMGAVIVTVGNVVSDGQGINAQVTGGNFDGLASVLGSGILPGIELLDSGVGVAFVSANDVASISGGGINVEAGVGAAGVIAHDVVSADGGINAVAGTGLAFAFANDVSTENAGATGINVEAGGLSVGIATGGVSTRGDDAYCVRVGAGPMGDLGPVGDLIGGLADLPGGIGGVLGDLAGDALSAVSGGVALAVVNNVTTEGSNSVGVSAEASGGIAGVVAFGDVVTSGPGSDGINATAIDGDAAVVALGRVDAAGNGSRGIVAHSDNGHAMVIVASDVSGGSGSDGAGVSFGGGAGSQLFNMGSIASLNDRAIVNDGSDSVVWNFGDVTGFVDMGDGDDTLRNAGHGRFIARGDSDFGDGEDSFINAGLVTLAPRAVPASVTIAGLETFDNSSGGTISLQDGQVNDLLELSDSNYIGGGILAFDAELKGGGTADGFYVGGNAAGTTVLSVNDLDAGPGDYNPEGVLFARVGGASDVSNFTTNGGIDKGLFRYDAYLKPGSGTPDGWNEWYLASTFDREAFEFPIIAAGAQNLWHASTGTWLDRTADLRSAFRDSSSGVAGLGSEGAFDTAPASVTPGAWLKLLGGTERRDISNVAGAPAGLSGPAHVYDDVFRQQYLGFMAGIDSGKETVGAKGQNETWLFGVMAGYVGSDLDFDKSGTDVDYRAGSAGAYATYLNGGFFADAAVKADFGKISYKSDLGGGFQDGFKGDFTSVGLIVDTGHRFTGNSAWFVEPKATLAYVHTRYDDATVLGTGVDMRDADSLRGRLGARVGTQLNRNGDIVEPWVEASAWHEFKGDYRTDLVSNGYVAPVSYDLGGTFGEVAGGLNFFGVESGWSSFAKGAVQFGSDDHLGFSGNMGIRKAW